MPKAPTAPASPVGARPGRGLPSPPAPGRAKAPWSPAEDATLRAALARHGAAWPVVASELPGRSGKQCRARWCNHLDPSVQRGPWTAAEDALARALFAREGSRWAEIARAMADAGYPRTDMAVKNRFNTALLRHATAARGGGGGGGGGGSTSGSAYDDEDSSVGARGGGGGGGGGGGRDTKRKRDDIEPLLEAQGLQLQQLQKTNSDILEQLHQLKQLLSSGRAPEW